MAAGIQFLTKRLEYGLVSDGQSPIEVTSIDLDDSDYSEPTRVDWPVVTFGSIGVVGSGAMLAYSVNELRTGPEEFPPPFSIILVLISRKPLD